MLKKAALVLGAVFVLIGVLGFVSALTPKGDMNMPELFGVFMVGTLHNVVHLVSGALALLVAYKAERYLKLYFQALGVVYGVVTIAGLVNGTSVFGLFDVNLADNMLHLAIAMTCLYLGYGALEDAVPARARA